MTNNAIQTLILNYQPTYNSNRQYQYQGVSNQLMFVQNGKPGIIKVKSKRTSRTPEETFTTLSAINVGESPLCGKQ